MTALLRPRDAKHRTMRAWGRGRRPVINISWQNAVAYCDWLSEQTGFLYRLPTEAEWEYAARAGTQAHWFHGDDPAECDAYVWYEENADGRTHPVGEKLANPWSLYDMLGNAGEWCLSSPQNSPQATQSQVDPRKFALAGAVPVARGGSWRDDVESCRSASRTEILETLRDRRDRLDCDLLDLRDLLNYLNRDRLDRLGRDLRDRLGFRCVRVQTISVPDHREPDT
ncbi:formylglycine-generating enzyme family protein [Candidatus Thiosymbion oneisti]|uniref:formylglycine-generating enzyme family protein n=1 Tax=Candidatus Thiosymbion oneisti TaxID=589554 RepID=UPI0010616030|nr:formylglycine-generating enzyme family protein [Candidatus Thiosymbion oneisti]